MQFKKTFYISLFSVALLLAGIAWFDYRVLYKEIVFISNDIIGVRRKIEILSARLGYLPLIEKEGKRILIDSKQLEAPHSFKDALEFLDFLETSAQNSGSQIKISTQGGQTQIFNAQLTGSFNNMLNFLIRLEDIPAQIQLKHIVKEKKQNTSSLFSQDSHTSDSRGEEFLRTELTITPSQDLPIMP